MNRLISNAQKVVVIDLVGSSVEGLQTDNTPIVDELFAQGVYSLKTSALCLQSHYQTGQATSHKVEQE